MKTKSILFIIIIFLSILSCDKESLFEESGDGTLLKSVLIEGEIYYDYTYNKAGLILEEKSKFHYSKHHYNSKNQLFQSDHYWDERIASSSSFVLEEAMKRKEWVSPENTERDVYSTFEYKPNGQLEKKITILINNDYQSFDTYSYNKNGRIERRTSYHENKASVYDDYFYDSKGNLIKQQHYNILNSGKNELQTTTEYELDYKHNPYLAFRGLMIPGQNTNPNNITKEIYTIHFEVDKFIKPVQITENNYEYNSMGFPIKIGDGFEYVYY